MVADRTASQASLKQEPGHSSWGPHGRDSHEGREQTAPSLPAPQLLRGTYTVALTFVGFMSLSCVPKVFLGAVLLLAFVF